MKDNQADQCVISMLATFEGIATVVATAVIAWFTVALASSTKRLWKETMKASNAALKTAQNMEAAERAYVKMSHRSPGVHLEEGKNWFSVIVEVRNEGRTPARITDVVLTTRFRPYDEALPVKPEYIFIHREEGPVHAFLVTREHFMYERTFPMRGSDFADAKSGANKLWMLGYVDYIDV